MTAYIQSLLFEPNNFHYPNILDNVSEYMLTTQMKNTYLKEQTDVNSEDEENITEQREENTNLN